MLNYLSKIYSLIRIFPINLYNRSLGIADYEHAEEIKYAVDLSNSVQNHITKKINHANQNPNDPVSQNIN